MADGNGEGLELTRYTWTYPVTIGDLHPQTVPTKEETERQTAKDTALLNRCLRNGRIIAKTQSAGVFAVGENGEHQLMTGAVTFIIGFPRKPYWLPDVANDDEPPPFANGT